jgi:Holliday junction resolvasome RuvABC ATP-dependent DNA helicase subunit
MNYLPDDCTILDYFSKTKSDFVDENDSVLNVVIKEGQLNTNAIVEYKGKEIPAFEFRPDCWSEFIGQTDAKARAKTIIKKYQRGIPAHFLVDGIKGHGKTTFCELVAKDLNAHIIKRIGKQINIDNLVTIINEINTCPNETVMLFVDEFDTMDSDVIKVLNPIIESFKINDKQIKPFIFAGATINKHILIKNNPDVLDRIKTHIKFSRYNIAEMKKILTQYKNKLYSFDTVTEYDIERIAQNSKFNPRTGIGILEELVVENNIEQVFKNCKIVNAGLTEFDIKILTILNTSSKAMGANALAMRCGLSQDEYLREFEPYLVEYGYINRVPSRIITDKGKQILEHL